MKKIFTFIPLLLLISIFSSCTHLVQRQMSKIEDRNFIFTNFYHSHLGSEEEKAYKFYKEFPLKKIMYLLAKEHNLTIDISEFQRFIDNEDISEINVKKGFRKEHFSWDNKIEAKNRIIIHHQRDYFEHKDPEIKISLIHGNRTIEILQTGFNNYDYIFKRLTSSFATASEGIKEYEKMGYANAVPVPGLIEYSSTKKAAADEPGSEDKKTAIKNLIKNHTKDMDKDQKAKFRHEMLDFIYKITE